MGLAELMSGRPGSPSGRSERASQSRSVVSRRSSTGSVAGGVRAGLGNYEDAYISQIIANDAARQEKQEASEMRRMGTEIREMWLAKVMQEEYDKKEARLGVIEERQKSTTGVRVREREYRKARATAMLEESKARVAHQEAAEKDRFVKRIAQSEARTERAEMDRLTVIRQKSVELATRKRVQAEVRERAATTYSRRLEAFAVSKQIKERSAKNRQVLLENERIAKFKIHREVEKKQQAFAAVYRLEIDEVVREQASEAYDQNLHQEHQRRLRQETLEVKRQRWRYKNRIKLTNRKDSISRFRRTGKLDASLSENLGEDLLANDMRVGMLKPEVRAAMESMMIKQVNKRVKKEENVAKAANLFKIKAGLQPAAATGGGGPAAETGAAAVPVQSRSTVGGGGGVRQRPQSAGPTTRQSTGAPQWRPPARPSSAASASSRSIAAKAGGIVRPASAQADYARQFGVIRPSVSMLD